MNNKHRIRNTFRASEVIFGSVFNTIAMTAVCLNTAWTIYQNNYALSETYKKLLSLSLSLSLSRCIYLCPFQYQSGSSNDTQSSKRTYDRNDHCNMYNI